MKHRILKWKQSAFPHLCLLILSAMTSRVLCRLSTCRSKEMLFSYHSGLVRKPQTNSPFMPKYSTVESAKGNGSVDWIMAFFWQHQQQLPLQSVLLSALGHPVSTEEWGHSLGCPALPGQPPLHSLESSWELGRSRSLWKESRETAKAKRGSPEQCPAGDWTGRLLQYLQKWTN